MWATSSTSTPRARSGESRGTGWPNGSASSSDVANGLALCFWLWAAFIAVGAGLLGASLNCEYGDCEGGFPAWSEPWTWGDYYVYPEVTFVAFAGLAAATAFAVLVFLGRRVLGVLALAASLVLLTYPFFAGLTPEGRSLFWFGLVFGLAAVPATRRSHAAVS